VPDRNDLDSVLDSALATYALPRPGYEERLLQSLAARGRAPAVRRHRWLPWAIAMPAAACLLMALGLWLQPHPQRVETTQRAGTAPPVAHAVQPESAAVSPASPERRLRRTRSGLRSTQVSLAALPKREVFPAPQPLTPAEQAFVRYVATAPEKERRALLEAQKQQDAPLEISAIKISPVTIPDQTGNQGEP
jgi:hypothetical protein